ncbi:MAG: class IIb bacteriocin, lactobin A/cerein 7B family [Alphaproteobacteria bacterium]|nr:class IIb bacteriocin, lactobin A/cerein 7B family [Alphaproteobacteria bacterium]
MKLQESNEVRELTVGEMDEVSGGWAKVAVGIIAGFLLQPARQSIPEFLAHLD